MKPCRDHTIEGLADLVAGRLGRDEAETLRRHLDDCSECRQVVGRLQRVQAAVLRAEGLAQQHALPVDHARIMRQAADMAVKPRGAGAARGWFLRRSPTARAIVTAAAAAVIIAGAVFLELASRPRLGPAVAWSRAVRGTVFVDGRQATLGVAEPLRAGQAVRTGPSARLSLGLAGGAQIELNENTSLHLESAAEGQAVCRVSEGQMVADLGATGSSSPPPAGADGQPVEPAAAASLLRVRVPVGEIETSDARFDLKVVPRSVASFRPPFGGMTILAAEGVHVLGDVGPKAEVRLTVLRGEVVFRPAGGAAPCRVDADMQLRYDPDTVKPEVRPVRADRYVVWQMSDEDAFSLAQEHLAELFAGQATVLPGRRVRLDYDFLSSAELENDWHAVGGAWTLHRNALRARAPGGQPAAADGRSPEIISRTPFLGDVEVSYEVTVDPAHASTVGWVFRYAPPAGTGAAADPIDAPVAGMAEANVGGTARTRIRLAVDGRTSEKTTDASPGAVFAFGGRIEKGTAYVSLQDTDVLAQAIPVATMGRLYHADEPQPVNVVVTAGGPDLFISRLTVIGRPDPRWLRRALERLFDTPDDAGR